ncbi:hypothetical protein CDL15_Pgr024859 [Punica granatum]|uniref:Uncharacterized protein n=1 Tax=Punica granatum TaxID=22663 RepID=A0A218Y2L8_PUNGR|nr:hypothetical protein CDL15_Pgr024859 [Punica granatum]
MAGEAQVYRAPSETERAGEQSSPELLFIGIIRAPKIPQAEAGAGYPSSIAGNNFWRATTTNSSPCRSSSGGWSGSKGPERGWTTVSGSTPNSSEEIWKD